MAKVTLSVLVSDIRNRLGNVVFSKWRDTNYVRQYVEYSRGASPRQTEIRNAFALLVSVWKNMGSLMQRTWNAYSRHLNMTGLNAFISANAARVITGESLELFKAMGEEPLASFNAESGAAAGCISCSFVMPQSSAGRHVVFFCQRITDGGMTDSISIHEAGADPASPYIITGLEPGLSYLLYAVLADNAYADAKTVSIALTASATAGA